jgi:hypothetical protein
MNFFSKPKKPLADVKSNQEAVIRLLEQYVNGVPDKQMFPPFLNVIEAAMEECFKTVDFPADVRPYIRFTVYAMLLLKEAEHYQ